MKPLWVPRLLVVAILLVDEFPNALGEVAERSLRTPFYGISLGAPLLYGPDVLILLGIALFTLQRALAQRALGFRFDRITLVVVAVVIAVIAAIASTLSTGNPLREVVIQNTTGLDFDFNQRGLNLIGVFQFKMLLTIATAYWLGRLWFSEPGSRRSLVICFGVGIAGNLVAGCLRWYQNPDLTTKGFPLFYDSPSTWFFAIFIFYAVAGWAYHLHSASRTAWYSAASMVLVVFIAVSFRRTMWGASLIAGALLLVLLPAPRRRRLILICFGLLVCGALLALAPPLQEALIGAVLRRLNQTSETDLSTVYRVAIALYMADHFQDIPFFGYGVMPLWNEVVALSLFRTNIENVHSLYYWWFLRAGWFGMVLGALGATTVFFEALRAHWRARLADDKVITLMLLLAFVMFAFSGVFNPVYGESRYLVMVGLGLALLSQVRNDIRAHEIARQQRQGE
jgi:hypothetical protein